MEIEYDPSIGELWFVEHELDFFLVVEDCVIASGIGFFVESKLF